MTKAEREAAKAEEERIAAEQAERDRVGVETPAQEPPVIDAVPPVEVEGNNATVFGVAKDGGIIAGQREVSDAPAPVVEFAERYRPKATVGALEIKIEKYHIAALERGESVNIEGFEIEQSADAEGNAVYFLNVRGEQVKNRSYLVEYQGEVVAMSAAEFFKAFEKV